jgi:hypothetical protein
MPRPIPPEPPSAAPAPPPPPAAQTAAPAPELAAPELPSPFFPVIVHGHQDLGFFPLKTGGVAIDDVWSGQANSTPLLVDEHGARWEPHLYDGIAAGVVARKRAYMKSLLASMHSDERPEDPDESFHVTDLRGDWPRSGTLSVMFSSNRTGVDIDYAWNGSSWIVGKGHAYGGCECCDEVPFQWAGHALTFNRCMHEITGAGPHPALTSGPKGCRGRLESYGAMKNLSAGELLAVGATCEPGGKPAIAAERWRGASPVPVVEVLPGSAGKGSESWSISLQPLSPTDVYVYARSYVAHHDGNAWTDVSRSFSEPVEQMWTEGDGTLWARLQTGFARRRGEAWETLAPAAPHGAAIWATPAPDRSLWARFGDDLWHLPAAGEWARVPLPKEAPVPERLAWTSSGTMIVRVSGEAGTALLSSAKPDQVIDLAQAPQPTERRAPFAIVTAPTPQCESLFVILYRLSRVAPPDFDFPLTRAALKGHTELGDVRFAETEDGGRRYLVGFVPSLKAGKALLDLVRDKVQGAHPQLLCGKPPVKRRLSIDLRTGALVK